MLSNIAYTHTKGDYGVVSLLQTGSVQLDDLAYDHFGQCLDHETFFDSKYTEEIVDELVLGGDLDLSNFIYGSKDVGHAGSWIKFETEVKGRTVLRVVFAKRAKKKIDYRNGLQRALRTLNNANAWSLGDEKQVIKDIIYHQILNSFDASPVFVGYQKTKTKKEFLLPNQYHLVEDISIFVDYAVSREPGLKLKMVWNEKRKDQIFYLQSRGISKERAMILANMENCYFEFDLKEALDKNAARRR